MSKEICSNEELVIQIKAGIDAAENMLQLWQQNQGFITAIAKRFQGYEDMEDLRQQGYIGLCQAVDNYNPDEDTLFMTYARFWIRQSMQRYIEDCGSVVRIPVNLRSKVGKYKKLTAAFLAQFGRNPSDEEYRSYLDISDGILEKLRQAITMEDMGSLDVPIGEGEDCSMYDLLPGQESPEAEIVDCLQQEQLRDTLWGMVDDLPGQQPAVIRMRYQEGKSLKETGEAVGFTIEYTRQQQNKALGALREPRRARVLRSLMYGDTYSKALKGNGVDSFNRTWTSSTERAALELTEERTGECDVLAEFQKEIDAEWEKQREWAKRLGIKMGSSSLRRVSD